ncbi:MAG: peptidoglycan DD-metalloendopeptidase family protein [Bacteroidia bacterium]|nr:peptidoglycan DD-metalloendopeptidase family protein [Bacteroidia bacterium]
MDSPQHAASSTLTEDKITNHSSKTLFGYTIDSMEVIRAKFVKNESLGEVLNRFNVPHSYIAAIGQVPREDFDVRRLQANKPYTVIRPKDTSKTPLCFVYEPNAIDYTVLEFSDSLSISHGQRPVDTLERSLSGTISSSLYNAILEAGGTPALVSKLADVYAWEIDFFGLQAGDCFKVLYTTYEVDGQQAGFGEIKAASFYHLGKNRHAFAYNQGDGREYFDLYGNSLRKTFLKAPLQFSRISSRFSHSRLHPVLKIRRPHHGVDYAAPRGTPVLAVGSGVVLKAAYSGGAGKMVKIRHNSNYTTAYLHLYRYGKDIRAGTKVEQGQIIGYVGSTGLSTGPHLDFRFYKNGVPVDPLKVDPPSSNPVKDEYCTAFMAYRDKMLARLDAIQEDAGLKLLVDKTSAEAPLGTE